MWYHYSQNNSFGKWDIFADKGIGPNLYVEANSTEQADQFAMDLGLYFDGVEAGIDCDCCGDRWWETDEGEDKLYLSENSFLFHHEVYLHPIKGPFITVKGLR